MKRSLLLLCLWLGFCGCGLFGASDDTEPAELQGITAAHNQVRANVQPKPASPLPTLRWSGDLAASAKAWANKCQWKHSGTRDVGENLFAGTGNTTPEHVVQSWAAEAADYDFAKNACKAGKQCGHYTQVAWRDTTRVGCAKVRCKAFLQGQDAEYWVCQYSPAGNIIGKQPY